ncbi:MAG: amidinotransferase [Planctomycetes bacterium RBG_16_64_12]|nr:MAG: amidinotransferase [Planctomycetes bacterium RBG_16_64_12]
MDRAPHLLMCPPDYYGIEYEINPWMSRSRPCDHDLAAGQWEGLRRALEEAGARISCLRPVAGLPDLVFTANAALVCEDLAILSRFRHPQRQKEEPYFRQWFAEQGYRVYELKSRADFEGAGDALFCGTTLFAGYRIRSDIKAYEEIASVLGCRVVPLELVDARYYHLDTCFCPIAPGVAIYYPPALDTYGRRALRELVDDLIPVSAEEAGRLAANAAVVGHTVVTPTGCAGLHERLRARGFTTGEVPLGEFIKAGGAAKCLTLRLNGEEAAVPFTKTLPPEALQKTRRT